MKLTEKEAACLKRIAKGMDMPNCGWYHEILGDSPSDRAVFGSLVKKKLATTFHDEGCDWIELTEAGINLA